MLSTRYLRPATSTIDCRKMTGDPSHRIGLISLKPVRISVRPSQSPLLAAAILTLQSYTKWASSAVPRCSDSGSHTQTRWVNLLRNREGWNVTRSTHRRTHTSNPIGLVYRQGTPSVASEFLTTETLTPLILAPYLRHSRCLLRRSVP